MKNEALISARKAKGLTQEKLAEMLDCQKSSVSNWENGYSIPKLADAFKLSKLLGCKLEVLFSALTVQESHTKQVSKEVG